MNRVEITHTVLGLCHMQVCAASDATDEEILAACNRGNPSGTSNGWCTVIRDAGHAFLGCSGEKLAPVQCADDPTRTHFLVSC